MSRPKNEKPVDSFDFPGFTRRLARLRVRLMGSERSKKEFARRLGLAPSTYEGYEQGVKPRISLAALIMRKFPQVNLDWLLWNEGEPLGGVAEAATGLAESPGDYRLRGGLRDVSDQEFMEELGRRMREKSLALLQYEDLAERLARIERRLGPEGEPEPGK